MGGGGGRGVRAKPWPGLLLLRYADGNIKDCHLPGFIHIRIHIYVYTVYKIVLNERHSSCHTP